jgi:hypothetical protein
MGYEGGCVRKRRSNLGITSHLSLRGAVWEGYEGGCVRKRRSNLGMRRMSLERLLRPAKSMQVSQ